MRLEPWQRNLAAVWLAQAISAIAFSFVMPFMPLYVQTLGVTDTTQAAQWAGLIGAATAASMVIAQPIWGNLADRYGRKPMLVRSTVGASIIITLMAFATSPLQLLALRFIQGSVTGVVAAATALVATSTPRDRMGMSLGMMQVALFLGTSVGPLMGGVIADSLGFKMAFYASGISLFFAGMVVVVFVKERFTPPPPAEQGVGIVAETRWLLALPTFSAFVVIIFLIQFGAVAISPVLTLFVAELAGEAGAATAAGTVLGVTGFASAASAVAIGRVGDRIGHARILSICLVGATISYLPQGLVTATWQLLVLRFLLGVFAGGMMPSANALVANVVPRAHRGAAYGLLGTANAMANGVGPLFGAGVATAFGLRAVFLATSALFGGAWVWVSFVLRRMHTPTDRRDLSATGPGGRDRE